MGHEIHRIVRGGIELFREWSTVVTFDGRSQPMSVWAEELGIKRSTLKGRLYKGWSVERALTEPVDAKKRRSR